MSFKLIGIPFVVMVGMTVSALHMAEQKILSYSEYEPGKFYLVTYEPETEKNRGWGQTATIWEADAATGTSRQLLILAPVLEETPRQRLSERELNLLEASKNFPASRADDAWINQRLKAIALLDADQLLVVIAYDVHEVMYNTSFGYYDFQILNLGDNSLTSILTIDYHANLNVENEWRRSDAVVAPGYVVPNPVSNQFAFSVSPAYEDCGMGLTGQWHIVDYSTSPPQVETLPFSCKLSWSPDGSMLAYTTNSASITSRGSVTYVVRSASLGAEPKIVAQYPAVVNYPEPLITWADPHTVVYQYIDWQSESERAKWDAYDLNTEQVVFSDRLVSSEFHDLGYLYDGQSHLIYGWGPGSGELLMNYTVEGGMIQVQTIPATYVFRNSKFGNYAFLGLSNNYTTQVLKADMSISDLDLSAFVPLGERLAWIVPGPPP